MFLIDTYKRISECYSYSIHVSRCVNVAFTVASILRQENVTILKCGFDASLWSMLIAFSEMEIIQKIMS